MIRALELPIRPIVIALNAAGNGLLRMIGIRRQEVDAERYHTSHELQFIIKESQDGGLLRGESGRMLRELFEFGDLTAVEVMVPRVRLVGIKAGTEVDELRQIVRAHPHTRYPVYDGDFDNIVGSLHIKDLLRHLIANRPVTANDARPPPYVPMKPSRWMSPGRDATPSSADGGRDGRAWRHGWHRDHRGSLRRSRRGDRRRRQPAADRTGRIRPRAGRRGTVRLGDAGDALGNNLPISTKTC